MARFLSRCGAAVVRTLAAERAVAPAFERYSGCLDRAGGELRKCRDERVAFEGAWRGSIAEARKQQQAEKEGPQQRT